MCNKVDIVFVDKVEGEGPGAGTDDLIDPPAVFQDVASLLLVHHNFALLLNRFLVTTHTGYQMHKRVQLFGLFEDARVTNMVHVKNAVCIDTHWVFGAETFFARNYCCLRNLRVGGLAIRFCLNFLGLNWGFGFGGRHKLF